MVYGIVAEYNPFHKGHQYLIEKVKNEGDFVVAVMSGNFVQRGDFAIAPKWERAKAALTHGVDVVIELPTPFALKSAEGFAQAAIDLLEQTCCINKLLFGTEEADLGKLNEAAALLDSRTFQSQISQTMKEGVSYPRAIQALSNSPILSSPNNVLAVEYLKALHRHHSAITPVAVQRIGCAHDSSAGGDYPSASYLRTQMKHQNNICLMERCDCAILSILRRMTADDFGRIEDVTEGLEHRIIAALQTAQNTAQLYDLIKSKRYTHARIRRIILRAFLGIETEIFPRVPYLKILGFHERAIPLLKQMRTNATLPLLQKHSDIKQMNEACRSLYQAECDFTDQYALGFKPVRACGMEMTQSIIKIKQEAVDL